MKKIFLFLIIVYVAVKSDFLSQDRKYTYEVTDGSILVTATAADGEGDDLIYDISTQTDGLQINTQYKSSSTSPPVIDFSILFTDLIFTNEKISSRYYNWEWNSISEIKVTSVETQAVDVYVSNDTIEVDEEEITVDIAQVRAFKVITLDKAVSVKFTLNPKTGYSGVLDVTQNDIVFDIDIDLSQLSAYTSPVGSSGYLIFKALLQSDNELKSPIDDSETFSLPFYISQENGQSSNAANLLVAKKWECSDSSSLTITQITISPNSQPQNDDYNYVYDVLFQIEGNFGAETSCLWDPVVSINENRNYTVSAVQAPVKNNALAIGLGVGLSILALIVIVILIYVILKRKEENQYTDYDVR